MILICDTPRTAPRLQSHNRHGIWSRNERQALIGKSTKGGLAQVFVTPKHAIGRPSCIIPFLRVYEKYGVRTDGGTVRISVDGSAIALVKPVSDKAPSRLGALASNQATMANERDRVKKSDAHPPSPKNFLPGLCSRNEITDPSPRSWERD
ncbi:hypothetical protein LIA77_06324 [Sarocladium implicatum]|nr:hypothetical protein LIA77_06324 [Sarocladium implicatum]